jgi:hypothetical protein
MRQMRNTYNIMVRKPERKAPHGRPRRRWEDSIRMDLKKLGWESVDWIHLAHDREQWRAVLKKVISFCVP